MKLPALALFERALRLETRSVLMCWARSGLLGVILFVLVPIQSMAQIGWYGAPGLRFLQEMVWVNFVFITLAGLSYFASAITEEKEEMTLGLLRMTDLNPIAILLGKSTSRLVGAFLLLLVQIPFILLAVTLGGVGLPQILAAYATLLAYMFLLCNLALLFSVVFRNTTAAAAASLFVLLLFFIGHFWAFGIERSIAASYHVDVTRGSWSFLTTMIDLWRQATPSDRLGAIFQTGFAGPVIGFQMWSNLALGVLFFLIAWMVFDRCMREEKDSVPGRRWLLRRTSRRSRIPSYVIGARAITWKDFTFVGGGKFGLFLKFIIMGLLVELCNLIAIKSDATITREFEGTVLIWVSLMMTAVLLALEASHIFKDEVRWKTLSSLMTLPISVSELAYRKIAGALAATLPVMACFVVGLLLVPDILFLHLTAFLSLVIKRGALPLAIAIQYLGGSFFLGLVSMFLLVGGRGMVSFIVACICLVLIAILHRAIGFRLARAAAEE
jgi:ABC-type transport system involved in multi-copper enzyme maturation permease subunit